MELSKDKMDGILKDTSWLQIVSMTYKTEDVKEPLRVIFKS